MNPASNPPISKMYASDVSLSSLTKLFEMSSWDKNYRLPKVVTSKGVEGNKREVKEIEKKGFGMQLKGLGQYRDVMLGAGRASN